MFAKWIPEALERTAVLADELNPPDPVAISTARLKIVNESSDSSAPEIETVPKRSGMGISISCDTGTFYRRFPRPGK
jgi:hypothetical protein